MVTQTTPRASCPDPATWRALLDGTLSADETGELSAHLERCEPCRQRLESLSGPDEECSGLLRGLDRTHPAAEPGLLDVIDKLKEEGSKVGDAEPAADDEIRLDFLDPPLKPDQLGRLGHYDVLEVIGRGGMGIVLKAFDQNLQRVVAVKVMSPYLAASASARRRFVREARAAAAIRNEHVIGIHAVEEAKGGLPYFVMEYIAGISLQQRLDHSGALELREVLRIGTQIARGLAAAHAEGLIHRDIKPANILLENGVERVKLTDFGLARAVDDASLTQSGVVAGTPQYMSPEQARGESLDQRSDLFSLGSVLYALCTGRPPFRAGSTVAVLKRICDDTIRDLRAIDPSIPGSLVEIIERLHAKAPAERFQSAAEVADLLATQLANLQQPGAVRARSVSEGRRIPSLTLRALKRRRIWFVALLLAFGGVGALFGPTIYRLTTNQGELIIETDDADVEVIIKQDEQIAKIIDKKTGRTVNLKAGKYEIELGENDKSLTLSTHQFTLTRGGKEIVKVRLGPPVITEVRRFLGAPEASWRAEFCLDDRCVLSGGGIGFKDGKLTAGTDFALHLWDRASGKELRRLEGHTGMIMWLAVSPDGKRAVSCSGTAEIDKSFPIRVWDLETGKELRQFTKHTERTICATFLRNGRQVVSAGANTEVRLWDVETCEEIRQFNGHDQAEVRRVAVTPDGKRMLTTGLDNLTILWDVESGKILRRWKEPALSGECIVLIGDGRHAALACWDRSILYFEVESGTQLRRFGRQTGELAISPDGRRILSAGWDMDFRLWDVATGTEVCRFESDFRGPTGVRGFTADGQEVLVNSWDGSLRLLKLPPVFGGKRN